MFRPDARLDRQPTLSPPDSTVSAPWVVSDPDLLLRGDAGQRRARVGRMAFELRQPVVADWDAVLAAADAAVPFDPISNREWLRNRQHFDDTGGCRRHYVAFEDDRVIGYAAIELGTPGATRARLFIVVAPTLLSSVGETLYQRLTADAAELGVATVWLREYARDEPLLAFLHERGFDDTMRTLSPSGDFEHVTLGRSL
jgi:N-acetylglutamate synthase-like GNAT family acetyltransferase